jgi:hypothetical protein
MKQGIFAYLLVISKNSHTEDFEHELFLQLHMTQECGATISHCHVAVQGYFLKTK